MSPASLVDRRLGRRSSDPIEHGIQRARIKFGEPAAVVNASAGGALIDTHHRLLPGTAVELHLENSEHHICVRGRVVRCAVVQVRAASVLYRGGIAFDRHLPWFVPGSGYPLPANEQADSRDCRADATRHVL